MRSALFIFAVLLSSASLAELRTFLEPRLVDEMDTVRLTIRADGTSQTESPDLSPLHADFEVLGSQTSSRISSINGRTIATVEYQISLRPRRTGELTLPRLKVGDDLSEAVRLVVRPLDPGVKETIENMVFFETEVSNNPVYVQAETILVRRLFYSNGVQIYSDLPGLPEVENAVVVPLGETQSRSVLKAGQRYGVIEQRFAIFPEQSGTLAIPSISVTSSVRLQSGGRTRRSGIRVSTEAIEVTVKPIPVSYPVDVPWLPATDVTLEQQWEPPVASIDVGEPLSFKLAVRATGNRGSAIPPTPLALSSEQFKIYPEAPAMDEDATGPTVVGRRRENYALIPTGPGTVLLPEVRLAWWDTDADELRFTSTAVRQLEIIGPATTMPSSAPIEEPAENVEADKSGAVTTEPTSDFPWIQILTVLLAAGAILSVGVLLLRQLLPHVSRFVSPALLGYRKRTVQLRERLKSLETAARVDEPRQLREALVNYLATAFDKNAHDALELFRSYPGAGEMLDALEQTLYRHEPNPAFDPVALVGLARAATADRHRGRHQQSTLPPLYA